MLEHAAIGTLALQDVSIGLVAQADETGLTGDRTRAGMIGSGVLWRFNPTFDYRRGRLFLSERKGKPGPWSLDYGFSLSPDGDDEVDVSKVLERSPAALAGIQKDDVVVMIDGWPVAGDINGANWTRRSTTTCHRRTSSSTKSSMSVSVISNLSLWVMSCPLLDLNATR